MQVSEIQLNSFKASMTQQGFTLTAIQWRDQQSKESQQKNHPNIIRHDENICIELENDQTESDPANLTIRSHITYNPTQDLGASQKKQESSIDSNRTPFECEFINSEQELESKSTETVRIHLNVDTDSGESDDRYIKQGSQKCSSKSQRDQHPLVFPSEHNQISPLRSKDSKDGQDSQCSLTSSFGQKNSALSQQSHFHEPVNLFSQRYQQEYFNEKPNQQENLIENPQLDKQLDRYSESSFQDQRIQTMSDLHGEINNFVKQRKIGTGSVCSPQEIQNSENLSRYASRKKQISKTNVIQKICYLNCISFQQVNNFNFDLALDYSLKCIHIKNLCEIENFELLPILLNNFGLILLLQGDLENSKKSLEQCLKLKRLNQQICFLSLSRSLILLGSVERERNQFVSALGYLNESAVILNSRYHFEGKFVSQLQSQEFSIPIFQKLMENFYNYNSEKGNYLNPIEEKARELYIKTLNNIALTYCYDGKSEKAVLFFVRTLILICQNSNAKFNIQKIYNDVLHLMKEDFKLEISLQYIEEYLGLQQYLKKMYTSEYITLIIWIGILYLNMGRDEKALFYQKEALYIIKKYQLQNKTQQHAALQQIGIIYSRQKQYNWARRYFEVALQVQERAFGKQNPKWIETKHNIGSSLFEMKKYQEAIQCYEGCLEDIKNMKKKNFEYLSALLILKIMQVYQAQGEPEGKVKIDSYYAQILQISTLSQKVQQQDTFNICQIHIYVSHGHQAMNKYDSAKDSCMKALQIYERSNESFVFMSHFGVHRQLGFIFLKLNDLNASLEHYRKALQMIRTRFGQNALIVADTRNQIANAHFENEQYSQAIEQYQKELQIRNNVSKNVTFELAKTKLTIASAYEKLSDFTNSIAYYQQCQEMFGNLRKILEEEVEQDYHFSILRIQELKQLMQRKANEFLFIQKSP